MTSTQDAFERARAAFPQIVLPFDTFASALARCGTSAVEFAEGVYVSEALATGNTQAIAWVRSEIRRILRSAKNISVSRHDDVEAAVVERLIVNKKVSQYRGAASLTSWLRVITVRTAFELFPPTQEPHAQEFESMVFSNLNVSQKSADSRVLQNQVGETLSSAMSSAALALTAKERTLLRLHFLEGMTLDELARTYNSHSSTVSRWLADAKEHFLTVVRDEIGKRTGMGRLAVDSLVRTMHGKLDISLRTALGD